MDDQQTYLLNGLIARQFGLGRIVRFRAVSRGRQSQALELFTAQEKEYLVQLFPASFSPEHLDFLARSINVLDENRFSVMPFLPAKNGLFACEGPQNTRMLVSLAPVGSALDVGQYSEHDISQVGLRLAWMHRLLREQLAAPREPLIERFQQHVLSQDPAGLRQILPDAGNSLPRLLALLSIHTREGWAHGDFQPAALLHDADHQLRTITDWGFLHYGNPLTDVVDAFVSIAATQASVTAQRGRALLEAYDSLVNIKRIPWTPVVATWAAQRLIDYFVHHQPLPPGLDMGTSAPEGLATVIASCL